jgi:hypothetical protein
VDKFHEPGLTVAFLLLRDSPYTSRVQFLLLRASLNAFFPDSRHGINNFDFSL